MSFAFGPNTTSGQADVFPQRRMVYAGTTEGMACVPAVSALSVSLQEM